MANRDTPYIWLNGFKFKVVNYRYSDSDAFAPQRREGLPKYEDYVPETVLSWSTWHKGYGDLYYQDQESYYESVGLDASILGQITLSPLAATTSLTNGGPIGDTVHDFLEGNGVLYAFGKQNVLFWDPTASPAGWSSFATPTSASGTPGDFGTPAIFRVNAAASTAIVPGGSYMYVGSGDYQYMWQLDGPAFAYFATTASHFMTIRNELWKLFFTNNQWQLAKTSDGVTYPNANILTTAGGAATINGLLNYDNRLYFSGPGGIQTIDYLGEVIDLVPETARYTDANFGKISTVFHGIAYLAENDSILQFNGTSVANTMTTQSLHSIGPDVKSWSQSNVRGPWNGFAPDTNFLYATRTSAPGDGWLLRFRDYPDLQPGQGWHPLVKFPSDPENQIFIEMGACKVSQLNGEPILWVANNYYIFAIRLPRTNDNPLLDQDCRYQHLGYLDLPVIDAHLPSLTKTWISFVLDLTGTTNTWVEMEATLDDGFVQPVEAVAQGEGIFTFSFASNTANSDKIRPRLLLATENDTQTPVVRSIALHYVLNPPLRGQWQVEVLAQEEGVSGDYATSGGKLQQLRDARNLSGLVNLIDLDGSNWSVTFNKLDLSLQAREPNRGAQLVATVVLQDYGLQNFYLDQQDAIFDFALFGSEHDPVHICYFDDPDCLFDFGYFS